jgi:hypothetical protein
MWRSRGICWQARLKSASVCCIGFPLCPFSSLVVNQTPRDEYERRIARWTDVVHASERTHLRISNLRLTVAGAAAVIAWLAFGRQLLSPVWLLVAGLAFMALVVAHARVIERIERGRRARRLYERGLARIDGTWVGSGPDGSRFLADHPYTRDLDLFGSGSLFQLLDTARTEAGEETLAAWLGSPAPIDEIASRHPAITELAHDVDFRETLAVLAAEAHVGRTSALNRWAAFAPEGASLAALAGFAACGATTAALLTATLLGIVPEQAMFVWLLLQVAIVLRARGWVNRVIHRVEAAASDLSLFKQLIEIIEVRTFAAPRLHALQMRLTTEGGRPSAHLASLQRIVSIVEQCDHNPYARLIATPLVARSQCAVLIDRWHARHGGQLAAWLDAVGELEAFAALATHKYEHPADPFPAVSADGPVFHASGLAHPLLPEADAVRNDIRIGGDRPQVLVVSGSNMSGKSTLLRAVGVNAVLAQMGAPVRALDLRLSPVALGATLRIEDSLQSGHSRFYTEILRIRSIVEAARGPRPMLFLLDEILHGTNSHDRRIGASAIVRALVEAGAIGLVTTHDLALTELVAELDGRAANVHFADRIEDGKMVFDYRMREGVVERSNALALMRAVGLDV